MRTRVKRRVWTAAFALMLAASAAAEIPTPPPRPDDLPSPAVETPLPPPRPAELQSPSPEASPAPAFPLSRPQDLSPPKQDMPPSKAEPPPAETPEPPIAVSPPLNERPEEPATCDALLAGGTVAATRIAPIPDENGCGIAAPVSLEAVILPDKRRIEVEPHPVLRCDLAAEAARWIAQDVIPAMEDGKSRVARISGVGGYECRARNRAPGGHLSEHARGNAMDITAIVFADGHVVTLASRSNDLTAATSLRDSACARFATVLGPGADAAHESHIHVDLEPRRNGGKICQWDLR
jgi:hypothetical protein